MSIRFHKYQATGNDFILFDSIPSLPPNTVRSLCDRHFGIGADGVLLTSPPGTAPFMIVYNADGSRPEMCANGLRCVALHHALSSTPPSTILTDAGPKRVEVRLHPSPSVSLDLSPVLPLGSASLHVQNHPIPLLLATAGNPHAIYLTAPDDPTFPSLAPLITSHPFFPHGTNTSFTTILSPTHLSLRVWERGVGPTLACGTAAAATTTALVSAKLLSPTKPVTVSLPGGKLTIQTNPSTGSCQLTGPARLVYTGTLLSLPT